MPNTDFVFLGYEQGAIMHVSNKSFNFKLFSNFCVFSVGLYSKINVASTITRK